MLVAAVPLLGACRGTPDHQAAADDDAQLNDAAAALDAGRVPTGSPQPVENRS